MYFYIIVFLSFSFVKIKNFILSNIIFFKMPRNKFQKIDFNPTLIICRIMMLSSGYYIINIIFTIILNSVFKTKLHINQILSASIIDFSNKYDFCYICSLLMTNFIMIFGYVFIVDKAKNILDFVLTNFFIHLVLVTLIDTFPTSFFWWFLNLVVISSVTVLSEYMSLKIDQKEIKLDFGMKKGKKV